jgi:hypothetical protein
MALIIVITVVLKVVSMVAMVVALGFTAPANTTIAA